MDVLQFTCLSDLYLYIWLFFSYDYFLFHGSNYHTWTRNLLSFRTLFATKLQFYINLNRLCKDFLWFSQPDTLSLLLEYHRILFLALSPHLVVNSPNSHQMKLYGSLFVLALFLLIDILMSINSFNRDLCRSESMRFL